MNLVSRVSAMGVRTSGTEGPARVPGARRWVWAAILTAIATVVAGLLVTGIVGAPYGADDNGDGSRLMCPGGLRADTPSELASWAGGVVLDYRVERGVCPGPAYPTSRRLLLRPLVPADGMFDLRILAAAEITLLGAVAGTGVFVLRRWGSRGPWIALIVLGAALAPVTARFFLSPFSETAGLVGCAALLLGLAGLVGPAPRPRADRVLSTGLVLFGGLYGGLAKQGNLPLVLIAAVALCACPPFTVPASARRAVRVLPRATGVALCLILPAAALHSASLGARWSEAVQVKRYTTHDLVLGAVAPELEKGGGSLRDLGLPETLRPFVGMSVWPTEAEQAAVPDWGRYMDLRGDETRRRALVVVATHPGVAYRMITKATSSYDGVRVPYLAAPEAGRHTPKGPVRSAMDAPYRVLAAVMSAGSGAAGLLLLLAGAVAAPACAVTRRVRRRGEPARPVDGVVVLASTAAAGSLALAVLSVLGDGYFELGKHLWLAAYLAVVSAGLFALAAVDTLRGRARRAAAAAPVSSPPPGPPA